MTPSARLQRTSAILSVCAGPVPLRDDGSGSASDPLAGRAHPRSTIVATRPAARACRWTGANRADVEELTGGRSTADSLLSATTLIVDAWGDAQPVPLDHWVVVRDDRIVVLSTAAFLAAYRIVTPKRLEAKEAA